MTTLDQAAEMIITIAQDSALNIIDSINSLDDSLNVQQLGHLAKVCVCYVAASIINSYAKRAEVDLSIVTDLFCEDLKETLKVS